MNAYTLKETITKLNLHLNKINYLYKQKEINWTGKTKDTEELYTEIIAGELIRNFNLFEMIKSITRYSSYFTQDHVDISINDDSNREEEKLAKKLAFKHFELIGKIIDYQVPLKDTNKNIGSGKIDILSFNSELNIMYLIELKVKNKNNNETLLRAMLEVYTYSRIVDRNKLCEDYKISDKSIIKTAVLLPYDCNQYKELQEMRGGNRPNLNKLAELFEIYFFKLDKSENEFRVKII